MLFMRIEYYVGKRTTAMTVECINIPVFSMLWLLLSYDNNNDDGHRRKQLFKLNGVYETAQNTRPAITYLTAKWQPVMFVHHTIIHNSNFAILLSASVCCAHIVTHSHSHTYIHQIEWLSWECTTSTTTDWVYIWFSEMFAVIQFCVHERFGIVAKFPNDTTN